MIRAYFENQVRQIEDNWLASVNDFENWKAQLPKQRWRLREMLGLEPLPKRTDLEAKITGTVEHPEFIVKKLHFQSMPGLYVTANLYVPKEVDGPLPGVLYVTGHANRTKDGVSLGSKTAYQRHPAWYARHGYVCLIIDTVQLGEIEGVHHGMYRMNRWWWWNRGYTPLGVEVWNSMRALDYLTSRPEVDTGMLAVTGRSGGGIYSWMLAALDDRITTAVPTAGITDLRNYILDGRVANHCDCMFMINTYRWGFPMVAALAAPRPMLLANGDHDPLFPIDGIRRLFSKTRQVYGLYEKLGNWNRLIVDAPHEDIPPLRQGTYRWMHNQLKGQALTRTDTAKAFFDPVDLKVFDKEPSDQINTKIDRVFVEPAPVPDVPASRPQWRELRQHWRQQLEKKTFRGWPERPSPLHVEKAYTTAFEGLRLTAYDFNSQPAIRLRLWLLQADQGKQKPDTVNVSVVGEEGWQTWLSVLQAAADRERVKELVGKGAEATPWPEGNPEALEKIRKRLRSTNQALAVVAPRGIGPTAWSQEKPGYEVRRSFMLIGQTRDGMRVWDVRRAVQLLGEVPEWKKAAVRLSGEGVRGGIALYAGIFEPSVTALDLYGPPSTHRQGPILLNVRKIFDMPQALALALGDERRILLYGADRQKWKWPRQLTERVPSVEEEGKLGFASGDPDSKSKPLFPAFDE